VSIGEPITFELDIPYADDSDRRHRLDLYLPKKRLSDRLPVIVFIHGGGWLIDDKHRTTRHQPQLYREDPGADTRCQLEGSRGHIQVHRSNDRQRLQ
jgi:hypothetical protein